jgi:hypothetical protein
MSTRVTWSGPKLAKGIYFKDLPVGSSFRIVNGHGAVYQKVEIQKNVLGQEVLAMQEIATGKVFAATQSKVEEVFVEITVGAVRPSIY